MAAEQQDKSEWQLAFDLQQARLSRRLPAKERVENWAGDLWAPLARHPAGQRGETDGPSGDLLAQDRGCSVRLCVCSTNRLGHVVLGDHLSRGCSSSLSCVIRSAILALPDIGLCREISYSSSMHFLLPKIKGISAVQKKTLCVLVINVSLSIFSPHIVTYVDFSVLRRWSPLQHFCPPHIYAF